MNPKVPDLLSLTLGVADKIIGRELQPGERGVTGDPRQMEEIELLLAAAREARTWPNDPGEGARYVDDCTVMLLQCLRNAVREGPLGAPLKWVLLAQKFLPFVRGDLARALTALQRPTV